jgi:hypothetical protein
MTAQYTRAIENVLAEKDPALMPSKAKERAERLRSKPIPIRAFPKRPLMSFARGLPGQRVWW